MGKNFDAQAYHTLSNALGDGRYLAIWLKTFAPIDYGEFNSGEILAFCIDYDFLIEMLIEAKRIESETDFAAIEKFVEANDIDDNFNFYLSAKERCRVIKEEVLYEEEYDRADNFPGER